MAKTEAMEKKQDIIAFVDDMVDFDKHTGPIIIQAVAKRLVNDIADTQKRSDAKQTIGQLKNYIADAISIEATKRGIFI